MKEQEEETIVRRLSISITKLPSTENKDIPVSATFMEQLFLYKKLQ
jgi:DNA-directed RNA polymerase subunit H (RpoH/RPB5)